jgi:hypothetical protein
MSVERLGLLGKVDADVLRGIDALDDDCVLITADDAMPAEHGPLLKTLGTTLATVDGRRTPGWGREEWKKEIVHRWAHAIHHQEHGTIRRYSVVSNRPWTRRRGR